MPNVATGQIGHSLFSVIITNYNYARYLRPCIESVLSQDYPNVEIVVVDDCSTDNSRAVIESFGSLVKPVYKANGGMISSWNCGWLHACGDMILILDADDFLLPSALWVHARALGGTNAIRSQGYQTIVDKDGIPTGGSHPHRRPEDGNLCETVLTFGPGGYIATPTSGNAWSRHFFQKVFPLPEKRTVGGDALLFDIAPLYGRTVTTEAAVASYRIHGESMCDAKARFTGMNISKAIDGYDFRSLRLKNTAESLGYLVQESGWKASNWRIATLRYLRSRFSSIPDNPRLGEHLATASGCQHPLKRVAIWLGILGIRLTPLQLSTAIASRMIKLQEI